MSGTLLAFALGAASSQSLATVTYLTQNRNLFVHAGSGPANDQTHSAPDFGPYTHSLSADDAPDFDANTTALQSSTLTQSAVQVNSTVHTESFTVAHTSSALSSLQTTFTVDAPTPWNISGDWSVPAFNGNRLTALFRVSLLQNAATLYDVDYFAAVAPATGTLPSTGGILQPGFTYTFTAVLQQSSQQTTPFHDGRLTAALSVIPAAPTSLALLACTGTVALRRRR